MCVCSTKYILAWSVASRPCLRRDVLSHWLHCIRGGSTEQQQAATRARTEALRLLPPFLALPADTARRILVAIEAIVTDLFPTLSHELPRGSTQATDYAVQLLALLDAAVAAAQSGTCIEGFLEVCLSVCHSIILLLFLGPAECGRF